MRLADYIFQRLADFGVRRVFLVTGGGAMHLNDALAREARLTYVCNHHEQASSMAAEGFARVTNQVGVVSVTSGPGGLNAINGVFGAWTDSIPMLVISGQMKTETLMETYGLKGKLRQLGDQEVDIIGMVAGITKYSKLITDPDKIKYELDRALHLATSGRPGPCWLDIPVDIQGAIVEPATLESYDARSDPLAWKARDIEPSVCQVATRLAESQRPVIIGGTGIRLGGALDDFRRLAGKMGIPVVTAWCHDLIVSDDPLFCGRQGTIGTRAGNFAVQNADFVLIIGSRMCIRQISYNWKSFARGAYTVQVDIDPEELRKPTFKPDLPINACASDFIEALSAEMGEAYLPPAKHSEWLAWCKQRLASYPSVLPKHRQIVNGTINQYFFVELLFNAAGAEDIFVCGDATACITAFQAGHLTGRQRLFSNSGSASMGYDLPAAIGAAVADPSKTIICLAGDGSIQMNIQEFSTIAYHKLKIKVFVLNNGGYHSIKSTQANFFKMLVGEGPDSGVGIPDFAKIAGAYGIPSRVLNPLIAAQQIKDVLGSSGPEVCVVELDRQQSFEPKLSSRRLPDGKLVTAALEDMAPFLDRDEFKRNMIIPVNDE